MKRTKHKLIKKLEIIWELDEGSFTKDTAVTLGTNDTNVHNIQKNKRPYYQS